MYYLNESTISVYFYNPNSAYLKMNSFFPMFYRKRYACMIRAYMSVSVYVYIIIHTYHTYIACVQQNQCKYCSKGDNLENAECKWRFTIRLSFFFQELLIEIFIGCFKFYKSFPMLSYSNELIISKQDLFILGILIDVL